MKNNHWQPTTAAAQSLGISQRKGFYKGRSRHQCKSCKKTWSDKNER